MPNKSETGGFTPEPGSKDAETAFVEGEEKMQERFRVEDQESRYAREDMEAEERQKDVLIERARMAGDKRDEYDIIDDWMKLEREEQDEWREAYNKDKSTDLWDFGVDFKEKKVPSFAAYLKKRLEENSHREMADWEKINERRCIYYEWVEGGDLEDEKK
ncbi:MAG: hypothetical protein WC663_06190 [Patescibacteria group bacterium]|jgi:hypothetical protein